MKKWAENLQMQCILIPFLDDSFWEKKKWLAVWAGVSLNVINDWKFLTTLRRSHYSFTSAKDKKWVSPAYGAWVIEENNKNRLNIPGKILKL